MHFNSEVLNFLNPLWVFHHLHLHFHIKFQPQLHLYMNHLHLHLHLHMQVWRAVVQRWLQGYAGQQVRHIWQNTYGNPSLDSSYVAQNRAYFLVIVIDWDWNLKGNAASGIRNHGHLELTAVLQM